jgi:excisionase family DNA binding protein
MTHSNLLTAEKISPLLTLSEASRLLHVHQSTLRRWSNRGIVRTYRIGIRGDRRFRKDDIKFLLSQFEAYRGDRQKENKDQ